MRWSMRRARIWRRASLSTPGRGIRGYPARIESGAEKHVAPPEDAFRFGENWQRFLAEELDPERERIAAESLKSLVGRDLEGRSFLDIGCGSGLFSLSAHRAGARPIVSVDVDPQSVAATDSLRAAAGGPEDWRVLHGSILDEQLVEQLEPAEIVYSWGVLHHTGDMWQAIRNATRLVAPGGLFCIAIYNKVSGRYLDSNRWLRIKRTYNHAPRVGQVAMEAAYTAYWAVAEVVRRKQTPWRAAREYKARRGMAVRTDLVDWLGGYPYEFATAEELVRFCEDGCGLSVRTVVEAPPRDLGNHELVFERPA
jgi:2-polyprenyl-3-methyl-5-hydroxy-6-metoxy-1,4-benzoquinol methylase